MSETKWTPGPWKVGKDDPAVSYGSEDRLPEGWQLITGRCPPFAFGCCVAHVAEEADARLISAAPDMAEALRAAANLLAALTGPDDDVACFIISTSRAALAKARGEKP